MSNLDKTMTLVTAFLFASCVLTFLIVKSTEDFIISFRHLF